MKWQGLGEAAQGRCREACDGARSFRDGGRIASGKLRRVIVIERAVGPLPGSVLKSL